LRWLMDNPPPAPLKMTITPAFAETMMSYNDGNRPISAAQVKRCARQMAAGEWKKTALPIIFSDKARLLDGQHRLLGCIESGRAFEVWVVFGEPDENFSVIDIGKKRTGGDIFSISGVPNANVSAAVTRGIASYFAGGFTGKGGGIYKADNPGQLYDKYLELGPDLVNASVNVAQKFSHDQFAWPSTIGTMHFLCARKNRALAEDFFEKFRTGLGFDKRNDPVRKLREHVIRDEIERIPLSGDIAQTWNAIRTNKTTRGWYSNIGGTFPRIM